MGEVRFGTLRAYVVYSRNVVCPSCGKIGLVTIRGDELDRMRAEEIRVGVKCSACGAVYPMPPEPPDNLPGSPGS